MFSTRKCSVKDCNEYAVTGSKFCFEHIENPEIFMDETISQLNDCDIMSNFKLCRGKLTDIKVPCRTLITSKFTETVFTNVNFDDASVKLCFFDFCEFHNCSFIGTNIRYSVFSGSLMIDCNFTEADILHTNFNGTRMTNSGFRSCDLYFSSFVSSELNDVEFKDCNLKKVSYINSNRTNVSFKYSNHEEAEFDKGHAP